MDETGRGTATPRSKPERKLTSETPQGLKNKDIEKRKNLSSGIKIENKTEKQNPAGTSQKEYWEAVEKNQDKKGKFEEELSKMTSDEIRSGKIFEQIKDIEDVDKKIEAIKNETIKRLIAYTDYDPKKHTSYKEGWFTLDYSKIGDDDHEFGVGLGDVLIDPSIDFVLIRKGGRTIAGRRGTPEFGPHKGHVGFLDEEGNYITTFTGDSFRIVSDIPDFGDKKSKEEYISRFNTEFDSRKKHTKEKKERRKQESEMISELQEELRKEGYEVIQGGNSRQEKFINTLTPIAKAAGKKFNLPWEAIVLQGALESGFKINARTLFGIKGSGNTMATREVINGRSVMINASFRDFGGKTMKDKVVNSVAGYCNFILSNRRYGKAVAAYRNGGTPKDYIKGVARAGYATDPRYFSSLVSISDRFGINIDRHSSAIG